MFSEGSAVASLRVKWLRLKVGELIGIEAGRLPLVRLGERLIARSSERKERVRGCTMNGVGDRKDTTTSPSVTSWLEQAVACRSRLLSTDWL